MYHQDCRGQHYFLIIQYHVSIQTSPVEDRSIIHYETIYFSATSNFFPPVTPNSLDSTSMIHELHFSFHSETRTRAGKQEKFGYSTRKNTFRPVSEIYFVVKLNSFFFLLFFSLKKKCFPPLQLIKKILNIVLLHYRSTWALADWGIKVVIHNLLLFKPQDTIPRLRWKFVSFRKIFLLLMLPFPLMYWTGDQKT